MFALLPEYIKSVLYNTSSPAPVYKRSMFTRRNPDEFFQKLYRSVVRLLDNRHGFIYLFNSISFLGIGDNLHHVIHSYYVLKMDLQCNASS